jgi:hypothetical protein
MAGQTDPRTPQISNTPVPDLIERYRLRRDAWIAQADELARLRDEVRSSAEREAMEIVTAARRDVRKVIMDARRELLVLSAQVQAALGESTAKTDPAALLSKAGITAESAELASLIGTSQVEIFAPEDAVNEILNEVHDDMTALAEDAKTLPLQAVHQVRQISAPSSSSSPAVSQPLRTPPAASSSPRTPPPQPDITPVMFGMPEPDVEPLEVPELTESVSWGVLSSPFPIDAVPVHGAKRLRAFVGLFAAVGVVVVGVTIWWLTSRDSGTNESASATPSATPSRPSASGSNEQPSPQRGPAAKASTSATKSANLSLMGEALRQVWVRTTVDGRTDGGRTLTAGQVIDVSADQSISLLVGDAGAMVVSLNNGEKRPLGRDGEVLTRQFAVGKSQAPRATPTPVPATPAPERPASSRPAPPVASAAPAVAVPVPPPSSSPASNAAGGILPTPATPRPAPAPSVNQLAANPPQPSVPGVVNQLSAPPSPPAIPAATTGSPATVVVAIARQWLDAYHRQDRATMAALSMDNLLLADERRADERFPPGLSDVTRTLDRVSVQIAADTAVLTAVMMEQSGSTPSPHVSPISQVWVLGEGQWKVRQARFVSEAKLNQVFK